MASYAINDSADNREKKIIDTQPVAEGDGIDMFERPKGLAE